MAIVLGAIFATGVLLVATGLLGTRPELAVLLAHLDRTSVLTPESVTNAASASVLERLIGTPVSETTFGTRIAARADVDLRVTGRTASGFLTGIVVDAVLGFTVACGLTTLAWVNGITVDPTITLTVIVGATVTGGLLPLVGVRADATRRRRACRHALSSYLDLVAIRLAGGAGIDTALTGSAHAGRGWVFHHIDTTLGAARLAGRPPWTGFALLGDSLGVPEFAELAASMALAGDEGARVRVSLAAKATAMRVRALAETERHAHAASERMSLPLVILMAGFVIFLGYPAVMNVVQGI